ncbi:28138_t:CDS:1 [Gigaspora margarita]|uniref:28138_t:CDS:1 n=1 Tax=Gigaspora margarita TaxID=4874 RepID=A0ABN7W3X8_GIGMA|nr:28138_t:CDS:1 [Gigaspora margarita]
MFRPIPTECLQEIFEHLQDDECTLFSILQVNRFWCKNVVSILWRKPFELCSKRGGSPKLVETFVSCMDIEAKARLKRDCKLLLKKKLSRRPPSFNYASYLRKLTTGDLWEQVWRWVSYKTSCDNRPYGRNSSPDQKMIACVIKELGLLFNKSCPTFDRLIFNTDHDELIGFYLLCCLPHIREFNYSGWGNKERNLDTASRSRNCRNIKKLVIEKISTEPKQIGRGLKYGGIGRIERNERFNTRRHFTSLFNDVISSYAILFDGLDYDPFYGRITPSPRERVDKQSPRSERELLSNLIKVQHRLEHISIFFSDLNIDFISSLETQSRTLSYLEFDTIYFESGVTLESLSVCENLETLYITSCTWNNCSSNNNIIQQQNSQEIFKFRELTSYNNNVIFPNLKTLSIRGSRIPNDDLKPIIKGAGTSLQSICLNCQQDIDLPLLDSIIDYCTNIRTLELFLERKDLLECFTTLSNSYDAKCSLNGNSCNLRKLQIYGGYWDSRGSVNGVGYSGVDIANAYLPQIGRLVPKSLRWLTFPKCWSFSVTAVEMFLKNCKVPLHLELQYEWAGGKSCTNVMR